jgi:hypothetical protein
MIQPYTSKHGDDKVAHECRGGLPRGDQRKGRGEKERVLRVKYATYVLTKTANETHQTLSEKTGRERRVGI